jgi:hypothetical protein
MHSNEIAHQTLQKYGQIYIGKELLEFVSSEKITHLVAHEACRFSQVIDSTGADVLKQSRLSPEILVNSGFIISAIDGHNITLVEIIEGSAFAIPRI